MAQINVKIIKGSNRTELSTQIEVANSDVNRAMAMIVDIIEAFDIESKGGEN